MSDQRPIIGKKGGGREIAKMFSELRSKPTPKLVLQIVKEMGEVKRRCRNKIKL